MVQWALSTLKNLSGICGCEVVRLASFSEFRPLADRFVLPLDRQMSQIAVEQDLASFRSDVYTNSEEPHRNTAN